MPQMKFYLRRLAHYMFAKKTFRFFLEDWDPAFRDLKISSDIISTLRFSRQIKTIEVPPPSKGNILIIAPHPDDEIIGPGGTILRALQGKVTPSILYITSGANYEQDIREQEASLVAEAIGARIVGFLRLKPKPIKISDELVDNIAKAVKKNGKNGIFIPFLLDDHPDHILVNQALYKAYLKHNLPGNIPIWAYQVYTSLLPNVVVDITEVIEQKKQLIEYYQSQFYSRDWSHYTSGMNAYNCRYLKNRNDTAYAELFLQIPLNSYAELCHKAFGKGKKDFQ